VDSNQKVYTSPGIVNYYKQIKSLQPAEENILNLLRDQLPSFKMLDLGIGGGRTTQYFAPIVDEYIGIDYSPAMIAACEKRFAPLPKNVSLEVADVRDLSRFKDNYFDFILFSFNGIDYIEHEERLRVFQEIRRLNKLGGYFCFSTHNLEAIKLKFNWQKQISLNPVNTYVNLVMYLIWRLANPTISLKGLSDADYAIIRDEPHNFRLSNYYVNPGVQLKQLEPYYQQIRVYSWQTGREIINTDNLNYPADMWLYYLCQ